VKIAHCQRACRHGDVAANVAALLVDFANAAAQGAEIVSFPECYLTGYFDDAERARRHRLAVDGPVIADLLARTRDVDAALVVGFNEVRGEALYNTVLVAERGRLLGTYSKAFPCYDYFTPGRDFPVFKRGALTYGVLICADGGFIEPSRILALKGAQLLIAPHYNYIPAAGLINHFVSVRADHVARARENGVWFLRGNSVTDGLDAGFDQPGVGYGDSYLLDPMGELVARGPRHREHTFLADVLVEDAAVMGAPFFSDTRGRSVQSGRALGHMVMAALAEREDG
jgi:predicted amidohydrolase